MAKSILERITKKGGKKKKQVIYGVYDNSKDDFMTRANDFLIDHSRISIKDKSYFFHMIAVMVDAGIPAVSAIRAFAGRTKNQRFSRVLQTVSYNSERGMSLSDSMSRFGDTFDEVEIGVIKSGEAVGRLGSMLFRLSDQVGRAHELRMKLWGAAFYPLAVLATLLIVAVGMLVWVFPTLMTMLTEGGVAFGDLPLSTRILLYAQTALVDYWWAMILFVAILYGTFRIYVGTPKGKEWWDYLKLRLPIIGPLLRSVYVLQFVSLVGVLIEAGLPVIQALEITTNSIPNSIFRLKLRDVIESVRKGEKISDNLSDTPFLFPSEVVEMIRVGEKSAALGEVSSKVSAQYQMEINHTLKRLTSVFEPLMILVVGLFVGMLALAVMAPIFNLTSVIS
ncbi:type II secretion system F family protein [Candidatus Peregrinibacteria bacterium]|jgi:type IV pilus assembly protein PilC|nr:type II secretion system F family protein [Candidatus Peregrinibacteria bacterium]MBT4056195.1 type II secretion system F family protein [Candidatus Peregrinibacteria bacterium]